MVSSVKREFLMLAHVFKPMKHGISGWLISEKLDGMRCFWDGGVTRGMPKEEVPWANTDKDDRYLEEHISSGLWSRYGNVIHAPDDWLDQLPAVMLDGELFTEREDRQRLSSIVKQLKPNPVDWAEVRFFCFDTPCPDVIFADGYINNVNYHKHLDGVVDWFRERCQALTFMATDELILQSVYFVLCRELKGNLVALPHVQNELPYGQIEARKAADVYMTTFVAAGGEGCIVRDPNSCWVPGRSHQCVKMKHLEDAEATVIGYISGRETDKGSKLLGLMGALILNFKGRRLELSGFTDEERKLSTQEPTQTNQECWFWACKHPGEQVPDWIEATQFPRGSEVTFTYRGLSRDGVPQEARFLRKYG